MVTPVTQTPAAGSKKALRYFADSLSFETDCWDTHESLKADEQDFILLDVRAPLLFLAGHIEGAINIPHAKIIASYMQKYPRDKLFVVYCAGPHCNGASKAAVRLAQLGLPVKLMIGGVTGWIDEGFKLTSIRTQT